VLRSAWTLAIEALSWMELEGLSERSALARASGQLGVEDSEALGLAHRLVFEVARRRNLIDLLIDSVLAPRSLEDLTLGVRAFLRLYVYEAVVLGGGMEEAEKVARMGRSVLGWRELHGVEEALGELLSVRPDDLLKGLGDEERVALLTFHPAWFVGYCLRLFGRDEALRLLEGSMEASPTYIRVNTLRAPEENVLKRAEAEGVSLQRVEGLRYAYRVLGSRRPLTGTRSYREGLFYIEDKASCLAAEVANPQPGASVLDLCAAPGAKTTHLAQFMGNEGDIYSVDYSRRRMETWRREVRRMGVKIALPVVADARKPLPLKSPADLVVLDPPCTGTGTFGSTPSAKWRLTENSIRNMANIQWEMLQACAGHVKEGGHLVYSTCSITVEENEALIERFLKLRPEFRLEEAQPRIGSPGLLGQTECQRLYPHLHGCDGFFVAKLSRG